MTTLLLVRHGETDWNNERRWQGHADRPLNDAGRAQARELADELAGRSIDAIFTSDLARAHETATIVGERLGLPVVADAGLREVDVGDWSGLHHAEIEGLHPAGYARWRKGGKGWNGGETYEEMGARVVAAVRRIALAHPGQTLLIVSHGGSIKACRLAALPAGGTDESAMSEVGGLGNCEVVELHLADGQLASTPR